MNDWVVLGVPQFWGLATAFSIELAVAAVLLFVLVRTVPDAPGPGCWLAGVLLALAGMLVAGGQMQAEAAWRRAVYVIADAAVLAGIGLVVEGLRRHFGQRSSLRWVAGVALIELVLGGWFLARQQPLFHGLLMSAVAVVLWLAAAWTALRQLRPGYVALMTGVASCALVEALGWALRGWLVWTGAADLERAIPFANSVLVLFSFVATGVLTLLFVLLVNFRLGERLSHLAVRDPLTGALNRRGFEIASARLTTLAARMGQPVALLMLDLDHFKRVNDTHGHQVGDRVLCALSQLVHRAKRETDVFARLGGEEFCLVLPGTDVPGAKVFADRLRRSFEALEIDTGRSFVSCTMSIGVAYASPRVLAEGRHDVVDLLRQADDALYEAKRAGRNRIRFYASPDVLSSRLDSRLFASTGNLEIASQPPRGP
ncbi:MAG TPA: GGDEF domain-containing protein [Burkholderiaceae bacterium]|nr:GGDEF domain-containing protein [Burkholderiaceae bacterium]